MAELTAQELGELLWPFLAALAAIAFLAWLRRLNDRRRYEHQRRFLEALPHARRLQQQESRELWQQASRGSRRLSGQIEWVVIDMDIDRGRALVRPARRPRLLAAIVGVDLGTGRCFLMPVPPRIRSLPKAMAWAWGVPQRAFKSGNIREH